MRFTASSYRYRRGYSAKNDGGLSYSGSKAQNGYKTTRNLLGLEFVINKTESPLDEISKNMPYKLDPTDLPSSPTGDMLTADLEIVTPLSWQFEARYPSSCAVVGTVNEGLSPILLLSQVRPAG